MKETSYGVIPILKSTREVLLVQSIEGDWGFPKGHKEQEDTDDKASALRELEEETGVIDCELANKVYEDSYSFEREGVRYDKTVYYYAGLIEKSTVRPQASEISDLKWCSYEEALQTLSFENAKRLLERAYPTEK